MLGVSKTQEEKKAKKSEKSKKRHHFFNWRLPKKCCWTLDQFLVELVINEAATVTVTILH